MKNLSYSMMPLPPRKTIFLSPRFPSGTFSVEGYGYREPMPASFIDRPFGTGDYLVMFFHNPVAAGTSDEDRIRAPHAHIWDPGSRQRYGHPSRSYVHSWLHCQGALATSLLGDGGEGGICLRPLALEAETFLAFLRGLHVELSQEHPDPVIAANLFENWARDAVRQTGGSVAPVPEPLRRARAHIDLHYA
ncbi:MAG TPA: hypothetical protein VIM58_11885, partial [Candidatus Methylacidiphilales bacterium]